MTAVRFRTEDGLALEGEIREADGPPRGTAVLCHPHPKHGGSKDHPVLWALTNDLAAKRRLTVLTFNFRGIMGSEGRYGHGQGELKDVAGAVSRVRQEVQGPTVLVGWSFGAWVGLRYAVDDDRIAAVALLAVPLGEGKRPMPSLGELERLRVPVLLVAGDRDPICPVDELSNLADWVPQAEMVIVQGADHFFGRREREVATGIGDWVDRVLG